ncbi:formin protein [Trifolium repens]|nr:formin protein [Trifolium repens]
MILVCGDASAFTKRNRSFFVLGYSYSLQQSHVHWDKVRAAPNRTMVWDKLRSSSFELDEEMIESLFGYNLQSSINNNDESKSKTPSPGKHVLDPKRLQNITILSKALNVTAEQVCDALMQGKGLSLQQLEALVKMVPTKEEEAKLFNYKGNINELGSAERFVRAVLSVPFAFQRVETGPITVLKRILKHAA